MSESKTWQSCSTKGLLRHRNGRYYARLQVLGKRKLVSLETNKLPIAKLRLVEKQREALRARAARVRVKEGISVMGDLFRLYLQRCRERSDISEAARLSREQAIKRMVAHWPDLATTQPAKVSIHDIALFAGNLQARAAQAMPMGTKTKKTGYSPAVVKRTLEVLQQVLNLGISCGALTVNPFQMKDELQAPLRVRDPGKRIDLPPRAVMAQLFEAVGRPPASALNNAQVAPGLISCAQDARELICGLAFTGMRLKEAAAFAWEDIRAGVFVVHGTKSASSRGRLVPIVPAMAELLDQMRARRLENDWPTTGKVFRVGEAQKSLDRACRELGIKRLTHHDFRHYFATTAIQSGVDIPTVSRWLGHSDGGALALRVYSHLIQEHSLAQAQRVSFGGNGHG